MGTLQGLTATIAVTLLTGAKALIFCVSSRGIADMDRISSPNDL